MADVQLAIKRVPIASLVPDPANVRKHRESNLDAIVASLKRFGQAEPLIVQAKAGRVIAGHGRLMAMKQLGWSECDVVELDVGDRTCTTLGIALNRTGELAEWDEPGLAKILSELKGLGELDGVGFSVSEVDDLIAEIDAQNAGTSRTRGRSCRQLIQSRRREISGRLATIGCSAGSAAQGRLRPGVAPSALHNSPRKLRAARVAAGRVD